MHPKNALIIAPDYAMMMIRQPYAHFERDGAEIGCIDKRPVPVYIIARAAMIVRLSFRQQKASGERYAVTFNSMKKVKGKKSIGRWAYRTSTW